MKYPCMPFAFFSDFRIFRTACLSTMMVCSFTGVQSGAVLAQSQEPIQVSPVTVLVIDERSVAAAEAGRLKTVNVVEGQSVKRDEQLASLESEQEALAVETAELNHRAAVFQFENQLPIQTAQAALNVAIQGMGRIQATLKIANKEAEETFGVQIAETERDAAQAELERATRARERNRLSVSESQLLQLQVAARKSELQVQQTLSDREVAKLLTSVHTAELEEQQASVSRFELLLQQEQHNRELNRLTADSRQQEVNAAKLLLERRFVKSPIAGVIAEIHHKPGEWVEKGAPILKVINLTRLRLEGFIEAHHVTRPLVGSPVSIRFPTVLPDAAPLQGVVRFVVPQVDPVNQRIRVWAEFDNPEMQILPGMAGEMTIDTAAESSKVGAR
jgi:multidrug resistance efflux pump